MSTPGKLKNYEITLFFAWFRDNGPFEVNIDFRSDFDAYLASFSTKSQLQLFQTLSQEAMILNSFFHRLFKFIFCSVLEAKWEPYSQGALLGAAWGVLGRS